MGVSVLRRSYWNYWVFGFIFEVDEKSNITKKYNTMAIILNILLIPQLYHHQFSPPVMVMLYELGDNYIIILLPIPNL